MDRDTLLKTTNTVKAGDRCENAYWLAAAANALAHELVYANKEQIGKYDAWEVAAMIEAATEAKHGKRQRKSTSNARVTPRKIEPCTNTPGGKNP